MSKRKPYERPIKATWWTSNPFFIRYIVREGTSIFVMLLSLEALYALYVVSSGEQAWNSFINWLNSPVSITFHLLCLIAVLFHSLTWFSLAPKTMDVWIKDKKVRDDFITIGHIAAFAFASLVIIAFIGAWL